MQINDEFQKRIDEMTETEMSSLLLDLANQPHWVAIMRYLQGRTAVAQVSLMTIDPVKEPTQIGRIQGTISGLSDLAGAVHILGEQSRAREEEENKKAAEEA